MITRILGDKISVFAENIHQYNYLKIQNREYSLKRKTPDFTF